MKECSETTISTDEIVQSKRAVCVLLEIAKSVCPTNGLPSELKKDALALMKLIRKIEQL